MKYKQDQMYPKECCPFEVAGWIDDSGDELNKMESKLGESENKKMKEYNIQTVEGRGGGLAS